MVDRNRLLHVAEVMADTRILKANYNAKLKKYFMLTVDRTDGSKKTWAIPAADVFANGKHPVQAPQEQQAVQNVSGVPPQFMDESQENLME